MRKSKGFRKVIASVITGVVLVSVSACSTSEGQSSASLTTETGAALLSKVQSEFKTLTPIVKRSTMDLWWINEDGYSIINDSSPAVEAQFPGCVNDDSNFTNWKAMAKKNIEQFKRNINRGKNWYDAQDL